MPIAATPQKAARVYRKVPYGPMLDMFFIDMRSYRGPNTNNDQDKPGAETVFLSAEQLARLKRELIKSSATWKIIAADMPIGLITPSASSCSRWFADTIATAAISRFVSAC